MLVTTILVVYVCAATVRAAPALHYCNIDDPNFDKCLTELFNFVLRSSGNGSEVYGLKPLEPLVVPFLDFTMGAGNVSADFNLHDVRISGLTKINVITVKVNTFELKLEVTAKIPGFMVKGNYHMEGGLLSFPLYAEGPFSINASDVLVILISYYKTVDDHLAVDTLNIDMIPSYIDYFLGGFMEGENVLSDALNEFLNQNSHEVFTAVKPPMMKVIGKVVWDVIDQALKKFPLNEIGYHPTTT